MQRPRAIISEIVLELVLLTADHYKALTSSRLGPGNEVRAGRPSPQDQ